MNHLYYGDNLPVLRGSVSDESVDLVYLDPPFNSQATYNVLFKSSKGKDSPAQIEAFEDTWHWGEQAEDAYHEIIQGQTRMVSVARLMAALRTCLGENDVMAYLVNMTVRLLELRRVLKPTGTLYLHCDPTASHYLKAVLDSIFGIENFRNEISWVRSQPKGHAYSNFPNCRDVILRYTRGEICVFNRQFRPHDKDYLRKFYRFSDADGRVYTLGDLVNPNRNRPNLTYEFLGVTRVWRWTRERMEAAYRDGKILQSKPGAVPRVKRYLDEMQGTPVTDSWDDIEHLHGSHSERLGYPTQKPLALLERVILASSNEGDIVLDPFCGCGTALHAAQKLNRKWIGIDITHLAISLIERRLRSAFPDIEFSVHGTPKDLEGARDLAMRDKYQFQWWALSLVGAMPQGDKRRGADKGIDGVIFVTPAKGKTEQVIVSVKGGEHVTVSMIRDLKGVLEREKSPLGLFITLTEPTKPMITEAVASGLVDMHFASYPRIQILSIRELLDGKRPSLPGIDAGMWRRPKTEENQPLLDGIEE
jgi:site-specific DNA-methyltransferase (adenine-specific)